MKTSENKNTIAIISSLIFLIISLYILQQFDVAKKFKCKNEICTLEESRFIGMQNRAEDFLLKSLVKIYSREHALEQGYIYRLYVSTSENMLTAAEIASNEDKQIIENFKNNLENYIQKPESEISISSNSNKNNRYVGIGLLFFSTLLISLVVSGKMNSNNS